MDIKGQDWTKKAWELDKNAGLSFALAVREVGCVLLKRGGRGLTFVSTKVRELYSCELCIVRRAGLPVPKGDVLAICGV